MLLRGKINLDPRLYWVGFEQMLFYKSEYSILGKWCLPLWLVAREGPNDSKLVGR